MQFYSFKNKIFEQLVMFPYKKEKKRLKSLRGIPKPMEVVQLCSSSCVLKKIESRNLKELNITMYATAAFFF